MATTLYFRGSSAVGPTISGYTNYDLMTGSSSSGGSTSVVTCFTANNHLEHGPFIWLYRVNAVTISGTVAMQAGGLESAMTTNATAGFRIVRVSNAGSILSDVVANANANHKAASEYGTSASTLSWSATPTSTTFADGDWIGVIAHADAIGTMGTGTATLKYNGSSGSSAECYVSFTETISAYTPPSDILVQPSAAAVTVAGQTATVVAQNYQLVQPSAAAVTIAGATPTVGIALAPILVQPAAAAVTIGTATPAIVAQNWPKVQPAAAAVTVGTATPAVVAQNWPKVQPAAAAVTIGTATPAVATPVRVMPGEAEFTITGATPTVKAHVLVQPAAAAVGLSGATPAVVTGLRVQPAAAAVTISTATPALSATQTFTPAAAAVTITTATPAISAVAITLIQPAAASVTISTSTPAVSAIQTYRPAAAAIGITTATPAVTAQNYRLIQPSPASVAITSFAPDLVITDHRIIQPDPASMVISMATPAINAVSGISFLPGPASLVIAGVAPRVNTTNWSKLSKVMEGLATTLREKGYENVSAYPVGSLTAPAAIVGYPTSIDYDLVYARGADRFVIVVRLVVGAGSPATTWAALGAALLGPESLAADLDGQYPWGIARVMQARVESLLENGITYGAARAEVEVIA